VHFAYPCLQRAIPARLALDALWFANMRTACYGSNTRQFLYRILKSTRSQLRSNSVLADLISASHLAAEFNHARLGSCVISSHSHETAGSSGFLDLLCIPGTGRYD
jgi:hypothetical protein